MADIDHPAFELIWKDQCAATASIHEKYGATAAFNYLVGEKLLHYVGAAATRPEFSRQLPSFVAEVRRMFSQADLGRRLPQLEKQLEERAAEQELVDPDTPSPARHDLASLRLVSDLLLAPTLGTG